ncbi:DinB family protein [bacterium]|nr:DinB family protein [bacterium]
MSDRLLWIERRFSFDFPPEHAPEILERLRGTPARLDERVGALPAALRTQRDPDSEKWSIQEQAGHLITVEQLFLGRLEDYAAGLATLRPAEMSGQATFAADYNAQPVAQVLGEFRAQRALFLARVEGCEPALLARSAQHPRLDRPMRLVDMLFFQAEHDDYHLARITELIRRFGTAG